MAKFLKSFFTPDKRRGRLEGEGEEEGKDFTPPMDGRRNLSISRSGRMRQASKKRRSLTLDLYGENIQTATKPKSREYHVNNPANKDANRRHSLEESSTKTENAEGKRKEEDRRGSAEAIRTPEEEIELAFEIIDKIS